MTTDGNGRGALVLTLSSTIHATLTMPDGSMVIIKLGKRSGEGKQRVLFDAPRSVQIRRSNIVVRSAPAAQASTDECVCELDNDGLCFKCGNSQRGAE